MLNDLPQFLTQGWTPGGVGVWFLVASTLGLWWRGLPAVLEAWTNRLDKERGHREREIERLERQIRDADDRHDECMKGQAALRREIDDLRKRIAAMVKQFPQLGATT